MNGGLTECGTCDCDPCRCKWIRRERGLQRGRNGKAIMENFREAMLLLPEWRMVLVKLLWPDMQDILSDLQTYYQEKGDG